MEKPSVSKYWWLGASIYSLTEYEPEAVKDRVAVMVLEAEEAKSNVAVAVLVPSSNSKKYVAEPFRFGVMPAEYVWVYGQAATSFAFAEESEPEVMTKSPTSLTTICT